MIGIDPRRTNRRTGVVVGVVVLVAALVLVWQAWRELPHRGVLVRSPIVLVTRPGNPHGIRELADLARPGVEVLQADPATSGVGELAILAAYGAARARDHRRAVHPGGRGRRQGPGAGPRPGVEEPGGAATGPQVNL